jgi:catechol 2,3-dioxygenase-like lactoylglutathione lyase family enzyme
MLKTVCASLLLAVTAALTPAAFAEEPAGSLSALSIQPSMNVFRRFASERAKMVEFYGDVLGLKQLPSVQLGGTNEMLLFSIGTGQVKLQATPAAAQYPNGAVRDVTGLRVLTFFYPDEAALIARFTAKGYAAPVFSARAGGGRAAMVLDPEKQWVELVVMPGAPAATFAKLEVGITASDLEKSRAFYRSFVGLEELAPVNDPVLGATRYPFRHGDTTINVWSFGAGRPANTSSAGIQYVVSDVEKVDAKAKAASVKIDRPLGGFGQSLRTIWLSDPDGVTNYFAQIMRRGSALEPPASR